MKKWLTLMLSIAAVAGMAQKCEVRIDLDGSREQIPLKPVYTQDAVMENPEWMGKNKEYCLVVTSKSVDENWREFAFIFTPEKDGNVKLILRGPWYKPADAKKILPIWVAYDALQVINAKCENPDFELLSVNGVMAGWAGDNKNVIRDATDARSGKTYIKVTFESSFSQEITVKKDRQVTIKFSVRTIGKDGIIE